MSKKAKAILEAALELTAKDRRTIAGQLLETLPPPPEFAEISERQFALELRRRDREMNDGTDPGVPWSRVQKMR
jgi:hypothetical protein